MKKSYLQVAILVIGLMLTFTTLKASDNPLFSTSDSMNVVIETCTGTWCQWCPCGHTILTSILQMYPRTVVLCYHGGSTSDPWYSVGTPMINLFGMSSYPSGVVGRSSGILQRTSWYSAISGQAVVAPNVKVELSNARVNPTTRTIYGTISATALTNLADSYNIFIAITEDKLVYTQSGNGSCTGGTSYIHDHVVRAIVTPTTGTQLTAGPWNQNTVLTYNLNYVIPAGINIANCHINYVVYKAGSPYTTNAPVQNGLKTAASDYTVTGIGNIEKIPTNYDLGQNYPNPFNPTTNLNFSVPKDGNVVFKIYDIKGKEVATYIDGYIKAGTYSVTIDGTALSSGIYFYKLMAGSFTETKRMMLVK
ncbi:MAG: Omp28-related outer membrane protein [Ignavibacteria bacterium]|nr:Omp28-related outer membrane protein [Ignavibacteria bacterium]